MPAVQVSFSLDSKIKMQAEEVFARIGLTFTDALRMFTKQAILVDGLPLSIRGRELNSQVPQEFPLTTSEKHNFWRFMDEIPESEKEDNVRWLLAKKHNLQNQIGAL